MAYIGSSPTKVVSRQSANIFTYTATANQTAFTGADANGNTLACSPSDLMVHMNGIKLEESDYTATTTTVTLGSGAAAGDEVTITAFLTFESADHYTKSAADTRYVNATGDTMSGTLTIDTASSGVPTINLQHSNGGADNFRIMAGTTGVSNGGFSIRDIDASANRFIIDSSGRVTMPYQPAFSVSATGGSASSGFTIIGSTASQSPSIETNVGSHFTTGNGRFTAPVAGTYFFSGFANFSTSSGGPAMRFIKNGSPPLSQNNYIYSVAYNGAAVSCVAVLAANDYVYLECNHYNNVTSTIYTSGVCGFLIG